MARRMGRRLSLLLAVASLPLALWAVLPLVSAGQSPDSIQRKIDRKRDQIEWRKGRERVLSSDITAYNRKIGVLQSDITVLQTKQVSLEADLEAKRAELAEIQEELRRTRLRLARLRQRLAEARVELANRLVQLYKEDTPDVVTVVLEADGFADLLERTEFLQRTSAQDARIIDRVREAKAESTALAEKLDKLEKRAEEIARAIEAEVQSRSRTSRASSSSSATPTRRPAPRSPRCSPARRRTATSWRSTSTRSSASRPRCSRACRARRTASRGRSARARAA